MARSYDRQVRDFLTSQGFTLERQNKHLFWKNEKTGVGITTSKTPSGIMALKQIQRELRRKNKQLGI